jgi:Family of unknown function (DUF5996)
VAHLFRAGEVNISVTGGGRIKRKYGCEPKLRERDAEEAMSDNEEVWPALPFAAWKDTYATLHMWTQIVGKVRLKLSPNINHWWGCALYVTARGLTTSPIPYDGGTFSAGGTFEVRFDFVSHALEIETSRGERRSFLLEPMTVAAFYSKFMEALESLGSHADIWTMPVEIPRPVRFDVDEEHSAYDKEYAYRFWKILSGAQVVMEKFRAGFIGKSSPVHFFWGSFDLCVTRFNGKRAPKKPGVDPITAEAYSHEVISVGWWPGDGEIIREPAFYAYAAPESAGFKETKVEPEKAFYNAQKGEFFLMYDDMREAADPAKALLDFCQSTYDAGASAAKWDREALEWDGKLGT